MTTTPTPASHATAARVMAGALTVTGLAHFAAPRPFDSIVPPWVPMSPRAATLWSGAAELAVAAALAVPATRRAGGAAAAALFVAVFPANVHMARMWSRRPLPYRAAAFGRLPLQVPMVTTALRIARAR